MTLGGYLDEIGLSWEVILVDDGTGDLRSSASCCDPRVRVLELPRNQGKGAAVRAGMLAAFGKVRVFTDVDLPYDLNLLPIIVDFIAVKGFHVVVGDRTLPSSRYALDLSVTRQLASAIFSTLVGRLVTGGFFDTQCGLKAFRDDVARAIFPRARVNRFAFDVELIYVALKHRLDIKRVPVRLRNNDTSSVRLVRDSLQMLLDVFRIKFYQMRGQYRSAALDEIVTADFQAVAEIPRTNAGLLIPSAIE
jgi:dolichyl-phosphate beta-glucosyltransferase